MLARYGESERIADIEDEVTSLKETLRIRDQVLKEKEDKLAKALEQLSLAEGELVTLRQTKAKKSQLLSTSETSETDVKLKQKQLDSLRLQNVSLYNDKERMEKRNKDLMAEVMRLREQVESRMKKNQEQLTSTTFGSLVNEESGVSARKDDETRYVCSDYILELSAT